MPALQIKRNNIAGDEPIAGDLAPGELRVNPVDTKIWVGDDSGNPVWLNSPARGALGFAELQYRITVPSNPTPGTKHLSTDNDDPTLATVLYINKIDDTNADIGNYLSEMKEGDWINIHRKSDTAQFMQFDIIGDAVLVGDIYEVPVTFFSQAGALLANGQRVRAFWRINSAAGGGATVPITIVKSASFTVDDTDGHDVTYKVDAAAVVVSVPDTLPQGFRFNLVCKADTTLTPI